MENNLENKDNKIILEGKSEKEILDAYADISKDTLVLHELLKRYENKQEALEEYRKIKSKVRNFKK